MPFTRLTIAEIAAKLQQAPATVIDIRDPAKLERWAHEDGGE